MADITITAANVAMVANAATTTVNGTAGAAITAGQCLYLDTSTNTWKLSDADAAATGKCDGVALNNAASGQPVTVITYGLLTIGGTVVAGTVYVASTTPGGIAPIADLASGDYVAVVGVATTTGIILVSRINSGVAI